MLKTLRVFVSLLILSAISFGVSPWGETRCSCSSAVHAETHAVADPSIPSPETSASTAVPVGSPPDLKPAPASEPSPTGPVGTDTNVVSGPRPKMVDLGAGKCNACKKMEPILEEAKKLYEGKADVIFIDVWKDREAGSKYGIRMIPTQIFFDANDKEVYRHEGFLPFEDIRKQFEGLGVVLGKE